MRSQISILVNGFCKKGAIFENIFIFENISFLKTFFRSGKFVLIVRDIL